LLLIILCQFKVTPKAANTDRNEGVIDLEAALRKSVEPNQYMYVQFNY